MARIHNTSRGAVVKPGHLVFFLQFLLSCSVGFPHFLCRTTGTEKSAAAGGQKRKATPHAPRRSKVCLWLLVAEYSFSLDLQLMQRSLFFWASLFLGFPFLRSIGDQELKRPTAIISSTPDVSLRLLQPREDKFLVLACDGVWDVLSDDEVAKLVMEPDTVSDTDKAGKVVAEAYKRGSTDNISVVVVSLQWQILS